MTFQERITLAFHRENQRRLAEGLPRLTKTELWRGVKASSGAATHWFNGSNGMDLSTCMKAAPILNVNPYWLFDESAPMAGLVESQSYAVKEPQPEYAVVRETWPFDRWIAYSAIRDLDSQDLGYIASRMIDALRELELKQRKSTGTTDS